MHLQAVGRALVGCSPYRTPISTEGVIYVQPTIIEESLGVAIIRIYEAV